MNPENEPQLEINSFSPVSRHRRTFGRTLQLIAHGEASMATAENWTGVCQSLQEKIQQISSVADFNVRAYKAELAHRRHDLECLESLTTNYQLLADSLDELKYKAIQMERTIQTMKSENERLKRFYYIRDWRCRESWKEIQRLDPSRADPCPTVLEDSLVVPSQPEENEYLPPRKKFKEGDA